MSPQLPSSRARRLAVSLSLVALLVIAAIVFRRPLTAWFTGKSVGQAEGPGITAHAGPFTIAASLDPDPPGTSGNALVLRITDASGKAVDDATVEVIDDMPAMGAMSEMKASARIAHESDGRYRATFDLPMAGSWTLKVSVTSPAGSARQDFAMTVGTKGLNAVGGSGASTASPGTAGPRVRPIAYPAPAFDALRGAIDAYERVRVGLAKDDTSALARDAATIAEALRAALLVLPKDRNDAIEAASQSADAATHLGESRSLDDARGVFGALNQTFLPLVGADARLASGWRVFECGMFQGRPRWMQRRDTAENPYMGPKMLTCGASASFEAPVTAAPPSTPGEIDHYTCSMHPSVKQQGPGKCPICGMDLVPVTKEQQEQGAVMVDELRRQLIGVRTAPVTFGPMRDTFRALGVVAYNEAALADVNLKVRGWITHLVVNQTGQRVAKGETLFTMYSPELYNAEQDFLLATAGASAAMAAALGDAGAGRGASLASAARQRLHLLGVDDAQIDAMAKRGKPDENITVPSPATGYVTEKNVVEGASVEPGMRLYRIAALNRVWIEADVYEADLSRVRVGQIAKVMLDYLPGRTYEAKVAYVYPYLDAKTRTGKVRFEIANKQLELRPGMYANIELTSDLGEQLQVPAGAVVYTGPRRLVFVDLGQGRFKPQEVKLGREAGGLYEVVAGLRAGDVVATSGVFLIAAEARISTAATYWESPTEGDDAGAADSGMPSTMDAAPPHATRPSPAPPMPRSPTQPPSSRATSPPPATAAASARSIAAPPPPPSAAPAPTIYTCPMHPEVQRASPGRCPKCGMDLEPKKGSQ